LCVNKWHVVGLIHRLKKASGGIEKQGRDRPKTETKPTMMYL